jgi:maleamate amidohydrolase
MSDSVALTSAELASELESWLSPEERKIVAGAGYGRRCGWGKNPALLVVDATYSFCGRTRMPIAESIVDQRRSCGEDAWDALDRLIPLITQARRAKVPVIFSAMEDPSSPEYEPGLWGIKNNRKSEDAPALASTEKGDNEIVREIAPLPG